MEREEGRGKGLGDGVGCLSVLLFLSATSFLLDPPTLQSVLQPWRASGDPQALQEIHRTGEGKMGPVSSFPQIQGIGRRPGMEPFSPGPVLWWLPPPPRPQLTGKEHGCWTPVGQMPTLPCISSGTLAEFLRSLILTVHVYFGGINSTY